MTDRLFITLGKALRNKCIFLAEKQDQNVIARTFRLFATTKGVKFKVVDNEPEKTPKTRRQVSNQKQTARTVQDTQIRNWQKCYHAILPFKYCTHPSLVWLRLTIVLLHKTMKSAIYSYYTSSLGHVAKGVVPKVGERHASHK